MKKIYLTLSVFCLTLLSSVMSARADLEIFEKIEEYMGVIQNNKNYLENQLAQLEEMKRWASEGAGNVTQKINEVKSNPLGIDEELLNVVPDGIPDLNNIGKAQEQVEGVYNLKAGQGNDNQAAAEQEEKLLDIQRENLANLYAVAFTTRSLLAKERQTEEPENDMKNTREIIKLINKKSSEIVRRLNKIIKLEAATSEFKMTQKTRAYSVQNIEEEGEEK